MTKSVTDCGKVVNSFKLSTVAFCKFNKSFSINSSTLTFSKSISSSSIKLVNLYCLKLYLIKWSLLYFKIDPNFLRFFKSKLWKLFKLLSLVMKRSYNG
ncbi:hypothetical protein WICPIJ_001552 [Wickerhamomyces pijperi]|uniref:Uncharacterized protein n=1 Tax=Wickerhamomyces pijperi TaxID=599730 RepID=A0A9P8QBC6_WICPI|nr:hypothetical protein WICPIJ_001552 [Wickerhamomyces pijperi]